jgi:hypothetical protein
VEAWLSNRAGLIPGYCSFAYFRLGFLTFGARKWAEVDLLWTIFGHDLSDPHGRRLFLKMVGAGCVGRGVVAFAGVNMQLMAVLFGLDVDGAVLAIALEERGFVRNQIAAAD